MNSCRDLEPYFAAYVDGDAPPERRATVQAHLERCPPCREAVAAERAARDVLSARRGELRACASGALRARCAAHCAARRGGGAAGRVGPRWRAMVPLSLAATLLLAVAGVFVYSAVDQVDALAAQVTADHVKCRVFVPDRGGDAAASAAHWVAANGWSIAVPESAPEQGLEFLTVRRCLVTGGRTAHMMYRWRGEPLSVFVVPSEIDSLQAERLSARFGHESVMWSSGGRTYILVARSRRADIEPVARYVRAAVGRQ